MSQTSTSREERMKKLQLLEERQIPPYADKFDKNTDAGQIDETMMDKKVSIAGRLMLFRDMGKLTFAHLQDFSGRVQIVFKVDELGKQAYNDFLQTINIGDFVGVSGPVFKTKKGEISVLVKKYKFLSKSLRDLPEKFHGIKDRELIYRQRYLDLIMNEGSRRRFKFRSDLLWELRNFYKQNGFEEVETSVLGNTASGALATPFKTHHQALDIDLYLRIAPEIQLKELIIGGYEKVFEVAKVFRNEGIDPSHLQEFSMIEHYAAYWDFKDNMKFTEKMLTTVIKKLLGTLKLKILNREEKSVEVDFKTPWPVVSFRQLLKKDCGIDIDLFETAADLRKEIKKRKIVIEGIDKLGRGNLIDALYKEVSRPKLVKPTFLINHPLDLSPLARKNDNDPRVVDRFQLVVNGWEIVNAYSELIDPIDQQLRFDQQTKARAAGDNEAMQKDTEFVKALEYGMPPTSGWGMGVERLAALLTGQSNLRDVVFFPMMKPEDNK
ncbi:MAG: lysine--tRNA ligase [Patescibacteria group bacterium]